MLRHIAATFSVAVSCHVYFSLMDIDIFLHYFIIRCFDRRLIILFSLVIGLRHHDTGSAVISLLRHFSDTCRHMVSPFSLISF